MGEAFTASEERILDWNRRIVEEAIHAVDFDGEHDLAQGAGGARLDARELSQAVLIIWARLFKSNTQWQFINIIGDSLKKYAELIAMRCSDLR